MTAGFIEGTKGEVKLIDVMATELQGSFLTREVMEKLATEYERDNPNVLVIRPWEDVPDFILANVEAKERAQILADRQALIDRRERRKALAVDFVVPTLGGDPERMGRELKRRRVEMQGLGLDHPEYKRLWTNLVTLIHQLEDICGVPQTHYEMGSTVAKQAETPLAPELVVKIEKYLALPIGKREKSILAGENPALLALIRDREPDAELQELAVMRLTELKAI